MVLIEYVQMAYQYFKYPEAFLAIPFVFLLVWLMVRKDWVTFSGEDAGEAAEKRRQRLRFITLILRSLALVLLLCAVASYFTEKEVFIDGEPILRVIIDNSSSYSMYDQELGPQLVESIGKNIRVETQYVGDSTRSPIGDAILSSLSDNGNVLVISDGQNNFGADLGDISLYASRLNATLHAVNLQPKGSDISISIKGPSKTLADIENSFIVKLNRVSYTEAVRVVVKIDGQTVYDGQTRDDKVVVNKAFSDGYHRIEAYVDIEDYFPQNNIFRKSVKVVPKPHVAFVTKQSSPMEILLSQIYDVDTHSEVPTDLSKYHAIVINNLNTNEIPDSALDRLIDFTSDGNGMFVVGGSNSFERGAYKDSDFEQMLPVFVAEAGKEEGDINVVLLIDISGSTGTAVAPGQSEAIHINKAQAISVFNDLRPQNRIGVVAFNSQGFVIEPMGFIFEKLGLVDTISKIAAGGGTLISAGLMTSIDLLKAEDGSKNIILISDGVTQLFGSAVEAAELAEKMGIKIYSVGVGARKNAFALQKLAEIGHGIYFEADQSSKLKILFGDVETGDHTRFGVTVLDENHFITEELSLQAIISGYNPVVPKSTANLLLTTDFGDPLLTVWRYGLGRIATWTSDDGTSFSGEMLSKKNSVGITRTMNWVIGDPDRNSKQFIDVPDTRVYEPTKILARSPTTPTAEDVVFFRVDADTYTATIVPTEEGFQRIIDAVFAVNYPDEYANLGTSERLEEVVKGTGGKFFDPEQVNEIVEAVKSRSKRAVVKKVFIRYPFIVGAMVLFLLDIFLRRLFKNKRLYK